jgi:hypothetical protein
VDRRSKEIILSQKVKARNIMAENAIQEVKGKPMTQGHLGCFVCGRGRDEILRSCPDYTTLTSIALCKVCWALPNDDLRRKVTKIREAMRAAREAAAASA